MGLQENITSSVNWKNAKNEPEINFQLISRKEIDINSIDKEITKIIQTFL